MLVSTALIGLREGLEASLVVVILIAFLVKTDRRWALRYVWAGVGLAVGLSVAIGAFLTYGTRGLSFTAQEAIGGSASILAVGFVTAMVFWMKTAARTISGELKGKMDKALELGGLAVGLVAFLGVGREGLETAIFFYATVQAAGIGTVQPIIGWVVGLLGSVLMGWAMYRGALRFNLTRFFRWTGILLVIVAAGILAYGLHDLQEAAILPGLNTLAFDVSGAIPPTSWYGTLLKGILNFSPQTTVLQAIAWVAYVGIVLPLFLKPSRSTSSRSKTSHAPSPANA